MPRAISSPRLFGESVGNALLILLNIKDAISPCALRTLSPNNQAIASNIKKELYAAYDTHRDQKNFPQSDLEALESILKQFNQLPSHEHINNARELLDDLIKAIDSRATLEGIYLRSQRVMRDQIQAKRQQTETCCC